jgi:hypothetical protein
MATGKPGRGGLMALDQRTESASPRPAAGGGTMLGVLVWTVVTCAMLGLQAQHDLGLSALAVAAGAVPGLATMWLARMTRQTVASTRAGTTRLMLVLAFLCVLGGPIAGVVCMVHTAAPGCAGWVSCGTNHPLIGVGVACFVAGLLFAAAFAALGLIARSVGEMQAAVAAGGRRAIAE